LGIHVNYSKRNKNISVYRKLEETTFELDENKQYSKFSDFNTFLLNSDFIQYEVDLEEYNDYVPKLTNHVLQSLNIYPNKEPSVITETIPESDEEEEDVKEENRHKTRKLNEKLRLRNRERQRKAEPGREQSKRKNHHRRHKTGKRNKNTIKDNIKTKNGASSEETISSGSITESSKRHIRKLLQQKNIDVEPKDNNVESQIHQPRRHNHTNNDNKRKYKNKNHPKYYKEQQQRHKRKQGEKEKTSRKQNKRTTRKVTEDKPINIKISSDEEWTSKQTTEDTSSQSTHSMS
jgi:hypothetical protein